MNKTKNIIQMLVSVIIMGMCVSLLVMTSFGPDPASAMNYVIASIVGLSFGTYQLVFNVILFLFILIADRSLLGPAIDAVDKLLHPEKRRKRSAE